MEPLLERAGQRAQEVERAAAQDIEQFMSEQVAEAEAIEGFASVVEAAAGAAETAAVAEAPGALALFGEAVLGTAAGMGAAAGGLAVAGAGAALVGTAWALHGGMVAAEHFLGWGGGGGTDTDASRPSSAPDVQTLNGMQEFGAQQHFQPREQRQRPQVFRIDTESEAEPRAQPAPRVQARPARPTRFLTPAP